MKTIIILLLASFNAYSQGFNPVGKEGANTFYVSQDTCEEIEGQKCFDVSVCPLDECEIMTETSNDPETGITLEQKVFKVSESKKAANEAKKQAEKDAELSNKAAKKALKLSIKDDIKTATTVAKLKAVIEKMIEAQE